MNRKIRHYSIFLLWALCWPVNVNAANTPSSESIVLGFVAAFNRHDVDQMLEMVSEDIHWYSVDGRNIGVETTGKQQLQRAMELYFSGIKSRSTLLSIHGEGNYVVTMEKSRSLTNLYSQPQCSAATYQLDNGKIKAVWYFPAVICD
ncbi:nuclear transport factor 2 family protein [Neptunicella sp. SCSIO 80796]|uniref:nuclear transport factor 2 family protein n=1 Tax=Neptunicella plasticusilytica TaxID=3117012 RepID=UPI003A4D9288